ncbi:hypothetical protein [Novacetimonas sp. GS1]|uniref:hypothetical protein n=1 Tax=Novacetimonas sp. GS1 TaxID=3119990 RepID=UPI002FCD23F2
MTKMFLAAQGDILIQQVEHLPDALVDVAPENNRLIVAYGEATGHHHSFDAHSGMTLFREDGTSNGLFGVATTPVALEHQEHSTITLPPGKFRFIQQRTMHSGIVQRVAD